MNDSKGTPIKVGDTLKRIKASPATKIGLEYLATADLWEGKETLIADAGYIKHPLTDERAKEFEVV